MESSNASCPQVGCKVCLPWMKTGHHCVASCLSAFPSILLLSHMHRDVANLEANTMTYITRDFGKGVVAISFQYLPHGKDQHFSGSCHV